MAATKTGWWLKICTRLSTASYVKFGIGVGGEDDSHTDWLQWVAAGSDPVVFEFDAPDRFINANELWWRVEPHQGKVITSLMYGGHCVQTARCTSAEEYEKHQDDQDGTDC